MRNGIATDGQKYAVESTYVRLPCIAAERRKGKSASVQMEANRPVSKAIYVILNREQPCYCSRSEAFGPQDAEFGFLPRGCEELQQQSRVEE